ncbi:S8 family serine peptidase [Nocardioides panzhihuensis]|uniref:Subtilisin family serine protease n=1 Tax=Nocardioides panzhihuensis TaxID=860243 RepID=A0A7Z0DKD0_9ACTN|nr:S8 family serine peptidase [Nocardioides panzhihuensis]NYI77010.1 subtilisin family serine protease [Nocardioides panzhihuensis]
MSRVIRRVVASVVAITAGFAVIATTPSASAQDPSPPRTVINHASHPVPGSYLVTLAPQRSAAAVGSRTASLADRYGGDVTSVLTATMQGYVVKNLSPGQAKKLANDPAVSEVRQSGRASIGGPGGTQDSPVNWGLDRIDQRDRPLDRKYTYPNDGAGANIYIVDTGIRYSHQEFEGRAKFGADFHATPNQGNDCNNHGSHVAGIAAGKTRGVAKKANLVSVRILGCDGYGEDVDLITAAEWVTQNAVKPAVVNLSVYTDDKDIAVNAIKASINSGVQWSLITGNNGSNACNYGPGGQTPSALQVANATSSDTRAGDSNAGSCMDLFAPGSGIDSAFRGSDTAYGQLSGTSMAAPHVAGAMALRLSEVPSSTPAQLETWILDNASTGKMSGLSSDTPNKLLYVANEPTTPSPGCDSKMSPNVVDGTPTTVCKYPFIISQHRTGGARPTEQSCTGTVVAKRLVLIAAHCKYAQGEKYLIYGRDDLSDTSKGARIEIQEYRSHPNYNANEGWRTGWDVAVIVTKTDIPTPAGMAYPSIAKSSDSLPLGTRGTAIGYGKTDANDNQGNTKLYEAVLPTVDKQNCANINQQYDDRYMMCSGYGDGSLGLCQGDSGGPYYYQGKVYGVFSWLRTDCASYNAHGKLWGVMGDWANEQLGNTDPLPGGSAPTAKLSVNCMSSLTCAVDGSASTDSDGSIASYAWNFGDGTTGTGAKASHTYPSRNGTYTVKLTVTDNSGKTSSAEKQVQCHSFGSGQGFCF